MGSGGAGGGGGGGGAGGGGGVGGGGGGGGGGRTWSFPCSGVRAPSVRYKPNIKQYQVECVLQRVACLFDICPLDHCIRFAASLSSQ